MFCYVSFETLEIYFLFKKKFVTPPFIILQQTCVRITFIS